MFKGPTPVTSAIWRSSTYNQKLSFKKIKNWKHLNQIWSWLWKSAQL